ncbi:hypothetical protein AGMMS49921_10530 [Endomicrobiia bacterium]|nr:hypothetical protein AGMMS49921_10530 [Endomicrobiia bacterium]
MKRLHRLVIYLKNIMIYGIKQEGNKEKIIKDDKKYIKAIFILSFISCDTAQIKSSLFCI